MSLPKIAQYPPSQEKREGIQTIIQSFLEQGIIVPCKSTLDPPKSYKKKQDKPEYRFVQDLRAINEIVLPGFPLVQNLTTVLSTIPSKSTHCTVLDLCSAFFSIPLRPDSICSFLLMKHNSLHSLNYLEYIVSPQYSLVPYTTTSKMFLFQEDPS